jgi:hypothetical protein
MKIHFERTGGMAGPAAARRTTVDADALPAHEAAELRQLVADAAASGAPKPSPGPARDAFHYEVTIEEGGTRKTLTASDADMPEPLRRLIRWLKTRATPPPG